MNSTVQKVILCVLQGYAGMTEANALCLKQLIQIWESHNCTVDVLSIEEKTVKTTNRNINILSIRNNADVEILRKIRKFISMPVGNKTLSYDIAKRIIALHRKKKYDSIICVVNPVESAAAIPMVKRAYPDVNTILYEIDPSSNRYKYPKGAIEKLWRKRSIKWEQKIYRSFDTIIHMSSHKKWFCSKWFKEYRSKTLYLDIPNYTFSPLKNHLNNNKVINMIYAGAFYPKLRNPKKMFEVIISYSKQKNIHLNVYTGKSMRNELMKMISGHEDIIAINDYISQNELIDKYNKCDVLVDLGNCESDFLSSKVLQYIGTCKPIIHFSPDSSDVSIPYLKKYPLAVIIDLSKDKMSNHIKQIDEFLYSLSLSLYQSIEWDTIKNRFIENTPEYSANQIMRCFIR